MTKSDALAWVVRLITPVASIAALGAMYGVLTTDISNLKDSANKLDKRVSALETLSSLAQNNTYRLTRLDTSLADLSKKSADDHDTLTRIDQTMLGLSQTLGEMKTDLKKIGEEKLRRGPRP